MQLTHNHLQGTKMKKLAVISMFVAATGLCFAGTGTAQGSTESQEQYGEDQHQGRPIPLPPVEIPANFEASNNDGMVEMRVDYAGPSFLAVLLLSTSSDRFAYGDGEILAGARLAGYGASRNGQFSGILDFSGSSYEGSLWMQAVIFTSDGRVLVTDIKRISMRDEADRTDPIGGPSDPDGDGGNGDATSEPTGSDENQNAGLETGDGDQAKA